MDFTQQIITYYQTEARHGLLSASIVGIIVTLTAIVFFKIPTTTALLKGMAIPLLIGGLIFILGGYMTYYNAQQTIPLKTQLYQKTPKNFISHEYKKTEKIHQNWIVIRIFWSLFFVFGLIVLFTTTKDFWVGIALGAFIIGTIGHIEESVSYIHNEKYRTEVQLEKIKQDHF